MTKRTAAATLALATCLTGSTVALAGTARAATVTIAEEDFAKPAAIVASGDAMHLVDSVTAGPFASTLAASILLVPQERMDDDTYYYLSNAHIEVVYIGGATAVGPVPEERIRSYGIKVYRLAGDDRYATARIIAEVNDQAYAS